MPTAAIVEELQHSFEPFFLIPDLSRRTHCERAWRDLLGDHVVCLEDPDDTCVVAASLLALAEGLRDLDGVMAHLRDSGTGAILLGAHLGSFYAMREQSGREELLLHPVVFTKNARRFNDVLEALDPTSTVRLIEIDGEGGSMGFMLTIREKLEEGGLVAILGDRVQPGAKTVKVRFLGRDAWLPAGPYILASTLKVPVYFVAGLYRGGNEYELYCIPFAEQVVLPRRRRQEALQEYAQQYAELLERFCRDAPENWFNFYDFWAKPPGEDDAR